MLSKMSSAELTEWMAFSRLEPFGSEVGFLGHAIVASTVANSRRNKGQKAYSTDDFMPSFKKKVQTVDQMIQIAEMFTIGLGGKDLRDG